MTNSFAPLIAGFLLGASLIIAIGAQNAFVLKLGIQKRHVFTIVMICALSDALLIVLGVAGFGTFVQSSPNILTAVTIFGAVFLSLYGGLAMMRAIHPSRMKAADNPQTTLVGAVTTVLSLTFLNPHVYLDTVVLLGGISAQYEGAARFIFGAGAALASFVWFFALGYGARLLQPVFAKPRSWQILEFFIAIIMWSIAFKLIYSHFQLAGFFNPAGN